MSSLPQRKKSAEEIAQLRESLGVSPHSAAALHPSATPSHAVQSARSSDTAAHSRHHEAADLPPASSRPPKPVRSLRKSEHMPVEPKPSGTGSAATLPAHRHSHQELEELRRRQALALLDRQAPDPKLLPAHPAWIAPGYLLAVGGSSCFFFEEVPWTLTATCAAGALIVALSLCLKRPISKHHAAFIAVISLLVIVFGSLHHFPQLQHAT